MSKAFDTAYHEILISKLEYYGINGKTLKWLKNYLSERKQCISYSDVGRTSICSIICGIPQSSILGPLPNMFLSDKDINKLFNDMNVDLQKMSIWFKANKLSLNLT